MKPEEEVVVACLPLSRGNPAGFDDDVYGKCGKCGEPIRWRPHAPPGARWCAPCVVSNLKPGERIAVTQRTITDIKAHLAARAAADEIKRGGSQ